MSLHRCDAGGVLIECNHQTYWTGHKDDPCPYCQIAALTAENKELRHTIERLVSEAAETPELLRELSRYRQGIQVLCDVDIWDNFTLCMKAPPDLVEAKRVKVIVMKEEAE